MDTQGNSGNPEVVGAGMTGPGGQKITQRFQGGGRWEDRCHAVFEWWLMVMMIGQG